MANARGCEMQIPQDGLAVDFLRRAPLTKSRLHWGGSPVVALSCADGNRTIMVLLTPDG